eukprot:4020859-Pyramimonas_sp.AAC.1
MTIESYFDAIKLGSSSGEIFVPIRAGSNLTRIQLQTEPTIVMLYWSWIEPDEDAIKLCPSYSGICTGGGSSFSRVQVGLGQALLESC